HDAIIDFVITHQDIKDKQSEILVTAVQKKHIIEHLTLFESAGLTVTTINVDMIALYALYQQLSFEDSDGTALIDIGLNTTDVALIRDSQLKTVRTISQGITTLAKLIAQKTNNSPQKAMEQLLRFGLEKEDDSIYTQ